MAKAEFLSESMQSGEFSEAGTLAGLEGQTGPNEKASGIAVLCEMAITMALTYCLMMNQVVSIMRQQILLLS
jgi:hypothetical protein